MPEDFYAELLDIPPGPRPPNHYRILNLSLFEPDTRLIHEAVLRQTAKLKRWALDPDPERARRVQELLNEVNRAGAVLEDPLAKAEYDWYLATRLGVPVPEPEPVAQPREATVIRLEEARGLARTCLSCGAQMGADDVYCPACGYDTGEVRAEEGLPPPLERPSWRKGLLAGLTLKKGAVLLGATLGVAAVVATVLVAARGPRRDEGLVIVFRKARQAWADAVREADEDLLTKHVPGDLDAAVRKADDAWRKAAAREIEAAIALLKEATDALKAAVRRAVAKEELAKARAAWAAALVAADDRLLNRHEPREWAAARREAREAQRKAASGETKAAAALFRGAADALQKATASASAKEMRARPSPGRSITALARRLQTAIASRDRLDAQDILARLEKLNPRDSRLPRWRRQVAALRGEELTLGLGGGVKMEFVRVRPGSFTMGDKNGEANEKPVHEVTITRAFCLGKYEVTQEQWQAVMGSNPSRSKGAKNPVENVSWDECQSFLRKLNERQPGKRLRLPTEAEWEYACRAGSATRFSFGDDQASLGQHAWFLDNSGRTTHPVGEKKPNPWGLCDVHGNVSEWCGDWYGSYTYGARTDPTGSISTGRRVLRGGSHGSLARDCRSACRSRLRPGDKFPTIGFRVAMPLANASGGGLTRQRATIIRKAPRKPSLREGTRAAAGAKKRLVFDLGRGVNIELVRVPPGSFMMGDRGVRYGENRLHRVTITKAFYLGKCEVTQEQWQAVMGSNPSDFKSARNPVENVSWYDCQAFLRKVNREHPQARLRLPTEAEWECACRAGSATRYCFGDDEARLGEHAWWMGNCGRTAHPVGQKKPNAWGLYDMHGNVWEWCRDWHGPYTPRAQTDPGGPAFGSRRVLRGGSWGSPADCCRSSDRQCWPPSERGNVFGFRVARSIP